MKNITFPLTILTILFSTLFTSCISIERAIKINEDGSGKEVMTAVYTKDFFDFIKSTVNALDSTKNNSYLDSLYNGDIFSRDIKKSYKKINGIKIKDIKSKLNPDSSMVMTISYTFDDIEKLSETIRELESNDNTFGKSKVDISFKKKNGKYHFKYDIRKFDYSDSNKSVMNSLAAFFEGQKMTFKITFPLKVTSSNASITNGKTLTWEYDMAKLMTDTTATIMEAEMKKK